MGKVGILSAVATANAHVDVDSQGDVPSSCDSPFIVSVTNTDREGKKAPHAGYGRTTIDLGAPGEGILSAVPGNRYEEMSGTSMATPHVAGAIALLHVVGGKRFSDRYYRNPGDGARVIKEVLMRTVTRSSDLTGRTVSGGHLNLAKAARLISRY